MKDKPQIEIFKYYIKDLYPVCIKTLTTQQLKKTSNPVEKKLSKRPKQTFIASRKGKPSGSFLKK